MTLQADETESEDGDRMRVPGESRQSQRLFGSSARRARLDARQIGDTVEVISECCRGPL